MSDENNQEQQGGPKIEAVGENADLPKFDFGEGELAQKVQELKEKLGIAPKEGEAKDETGKPEGPITGEGIDWTEFDLDPNFAHLYPQARVVDTAQGPKWAVMLDEFMTREKNANPPAQVRRNEKTGENSYMGDFVTETLAQAPEQACTTWKLVAFVPGSMTGMMQVIFQRKKQVGLPDPKLIEKEEDQTPPAPQDDELGDIEKKAAEWAGDAPPETPYTSAPEGEPSTDGAVEGE